MVWIFHCLHWTWHSCKILLQCEAVLKLQLGCLKRQYVTFLMRKYSRVSSVQITESLDTLRHILLTSMSFFHPTIWCIVGKLSYHSQQQVWSLLLACDGWSKVLSLVWKLCGLTEAQCGVVHGVYSFGLLGSGCDKWSSLRRIMCIVWEHLLPFIHCGILAAAQLFVRVVTSQGP